MIQKFAERFTERLPDIKDFFRKKHPDNYLEIVEMVVNTLAGIDEYNSPSVERITEIDYGEYQGTLIYIIGGDSYQPGVEDCWITSVCYGSCSGCDALEGIREYSDDPPTEDEVSQYVALATHILQRMKKLNDAGVEDE